MSGLLVFGRSGQVATELARLAPEATFLDRARADLSDPEACAAAIRELLPAGIINAAAYTAVDRAESEPDLARAVNAEAPAAMARRACALRAPASAPRAWAWVNCWLCSAISRSSSVWAAPRSTMSFWFL